MSMSYLDITVVGEVTLKDGALQLKGGGMSQQFVLRGAKEDKSGALERLGEAVAAGAKTVSITGRVDGWSGRFPLLLSALAKRSAQEPVVLFVTDFESKK